MAHFTVHLTSTDAQANRQQLDQLFRNLVNVSPCIPLRLTLTCDEDASIMAEDSRRFINSVVSTFTSTRWISLHVQGIGPYAVYEALLVALQTEVWPQLTWLHVEASHEDGYSNTQLLLPNAPVLRHLYCKLRTTAHVPEFPLHPIALNQLVCLELDNYTRSADLVRLLHYTPLLETLNLRMHGDEILAAPEQQSYIVHLPRLQHLVLLTAPNLRILDWFCTPQLRGLQIEMMDVLPIDPASSQAAMAPLAHFINSMCRLTLTHLKLVRCPLSDEWLRDLLVGTSQLQELRVWWGPTGTILQYLAVLSEVPRANFDKTYEGNEKVLSPACAPLMEHLELCVHPADWDGEGQRHLLKAGKDAMIEWRKQAARPALSPLQLVEAKAIHRDDDESDRSLLIEIGMRQT